MRISVIIPVHNGAETLAACLRAVCNQAYPAAEIIVVDDASRDGTAACAAQYPCRVITLTTNEGAARAKNAGAMQAAGEAVFFTDADVLLPPDALAIVAERLVDPQVTGVVGLLGAEIPHSNFSSQFKNLWMHHTYRRLPEEVGLFFTSAAAMRRPAFLSEGGFDPGYRGASVAEDMEFGQRARTNGRRIVLDQRLTVQHLKHYTLGEVLRTDIARARALVLIVLRSLAFSGNAHRDPWLMADAQPSNPNFRKIALGAPSRKRQHYASVPTSFGLSVPLAGLLALAVLSLPWTGLWGLGAALACFAAITALNARFLGFLTRQRGWWFGGRSALFLPPDLFCSGLGVVVALVDYLCGHRY
jgi:GT2 family glycosyltransferase